MYKLILFLRIEVLILILEHSNNELELSEQYCYGRKTKRKSRK